VRRLLGNLGSLLVVVTLLFVVFQTMPGGLSTLGAGLPTEVRDRLRREYGLDQPVMTQYANFMGHMLTANYGTSFSTKQPASDLMGERAGNTLKLWGVAASFSVLLSLVILVPGLLVLWLRGKARLLGNGLGRLGQCIASLKFLIPALAAGAVLFAILAVKLRVFPASGMSSPGMAPSDLGDFLKHAFLPALSLALLPAYLVARSVAGEFAHYTDRRNVNRWLFVGHAAARFVADSLIQGIGILGGVLVIEALFAWPGLGRTIYQAVTTRDYPVLLGATMTLLWLTLILRVFSDLFRAVSLGLSAWLDGKAEERKPRPARSQHRVLGIAWVLLAVLLVLVPVVIGLGGASFVPYDPSLQSVRDRLLPPGGGHLLGTDTLGRDVLSRLVYAMRLDLGIALLMTLMAFIPATLGGLLAGFLARRKALWADLLDGLVMFPAEALATLPGLLLLVAASGTWLAMRKDAPVSWLPLAVFVAGLYVLPRVMRMVREGTATIPTQSSAGRTVLYFLGMLGAVLLIAPTLGLFALSAIAFLGLGETPPAAQLGSMIQESLASARTVDLPWGILAPALALVFLSGGWFLLAETVLSKVGVHKRESWLDINR
jgi:peptide/nickel transport system permease protein